MATYSIENRIFIIQTFYKFGKSPTQVCRKYRTHFNTKDVPSIQAISKQLIVKKLKNFEIFLGLKITIFLPFYKV